MKKLNFLNEKSMSGLLIGVFLTLSIVLSIMYADYYGAYMISVMPAVFLAFILPDDYCKRLNDKKADKVKGIKSVNSMQYITSIITYLIFVMIEVIRTSYCGDDLIKSCIRIFIAGSTIALFLTYMRYEKTDNNYIKGFIFGIYMYLVIFISKVDESNYFLGDNIILSVIVGMIEVILASFVCNKIRHKTMKI